MRERERQGGMEGRREREREDLRHERATSLMLLDNIRVADLLDLLIAPDLFKGSSFRVLDLGLEVLRLGFMVLS